MCNETLSEVLDARKPHAPLWIEMGFATDQLTTVHCSLTTALRALTGDGRFCGRKSEKPARSIPYAARMPNAIDPTDAQTNITKFNKSDIDPA
jgi:hypothetical protein